METQLTNVGGRPPIEFDPYDEFLIQELARLNATDEEIASRLGVSVRTLERRRQADPKFAALFDRSKAEGKISLRRSQFQSALRGSVPMQIWLGKQLLNQRDKHEISGPNGGAIELSYIRKMLDQLPEEDFLQWAAENGVELPDPETIDITPVTAEIAAAENNPDDKPSDKPDDTTQSD